MKPDPKWSFVLTVLLFAGMMIGLSLSVLNDFMSQAAPLAGRDMFVMTMHVIWLLLWFVATIFALRYALQPRHTATGHNAAGQQPSGREGAPATCARQVQNPATSEY